MSTFRFGVVVDTCGFWPYAHFAEFFTKGAAMDAIKALLAAPFGKVTEIEQTELNQTGIHPVSLYASLGLKAPDPTTTARPHGQDFDEIVQEACNQGWTIEEITPRTHLGRWCLLNPPPSIGGDFRHVGGENQYQVYEEEDGGSWLYECGGKWELRFPGMRRDVPPDEVARMLDLGEFFGGLDGEAVEEIGTYVQPFPTVAPTEFSCRLRVLELLRFVKDGVTAYGYKTDEGEVMISPDRDSAIKNAKEDMNDWDQSESLGDFHEPDALFFAIVAYTPDGGVIPISALSKELAEIPGLSQTVNFREHAYEWASVEPLAISINGHPIRRIYSLQMSPGAFLADHPFV